MALLMSLLEVEPCLWFCRSRVKGLRVAMFWQLDDKLKMFMTPGAVGEPDLKRGTVLFLLRKLKIHNVIFTLFMSY